jgi:tryptophan synthase beta chain
VLHGALSYLLQSPQGQILPSHSLAPGLDYPGVGPEHAHLRDSGRVEYKTVRDEAAYRAFKRLARKEGIIPALESSHALAGALEWGGELGPESRVLVNLSGRGDKDLEIVFEYEDARGGKEASHG